MTVAPHTVGVARQSTSWRDWCVAVAGLVYLALSLTSSVWYLTLLQPAMTNNLYWPHFNATGVQSFVINQLNVHLTTRPRGAVDLLAASAVSSHDYSTEVIQPEFSPLYARRVLYTELNTLPRAIRDLRTTATASAVWAQYCWLDLDKRWDVAHTAARSARCAAHYHDNAAVYVETLLRNVNWGEFLETNGEYWDVAVAAELSKVAVGRTWLSERPVWARRLGVADEVAFLVSKDLHRFDVTWQNALTVGIDETVVIENALGIRQSVQIKAAAMDYAAWTSGIMFLNFFNDLANGYMLNTSLVRSAANSFDHVGRPFDLIYAMRASASDVYVGQAAVFVEQIGPFGSVDASVEPVPPALTALVAAFESLVYGQGLSSPVGDEWHALRRQELEPFAVAPPAFAGDYSFYGGNVLCLYNSPTTYPQSQISYDDTCTTQSPFSMRASSTMALLFAAFAANLISSNDLAPYLSTAADSALMHRALELVRSFGTLPHASDVQTAAAALPPIQLVQYAQSMNGSWVLLQQPLVVSESAWSFFGWLALFDWATDTREVLRMDGDVATLFVMSEPYAKSVLPSSAGSSEMTSNTQVVFYVVVYTTVVLVAVGAVVLVQTLWCLADPGHGLMVFHRIVGSVWIGRPLLFLRGMTTMVMLSSIHVELAKLPSGETSLAATPRSILATMVLAGEAAWVAFAVNDLLLLVARQQSTRTNAHAAALVAWTATVVLEWSQPIALVTTLDRQCTVDGTDRFVRCQSGLVQVGDWRRLVWLIGIHVSCVVASIAGDELALLRRRGQVSAVAPDQPRPHASLALHAAAQAFLNPSAMTAEVYLLDSATCVMCGLLPLGPLGLFDIRLWVLHRQQDNPDKVSTFDAPMLTQAKSSRLVLKRPRFSSCSYDGSSGIPMLGGHDSRPATAINQSAKRAKVAFGVAYILFTVAGSVSYIALSSVNFANDFYWPAFNLSGHHVALGDWFTEQLVLGRTNLLRNVALNEPRWAIPSETFTNVANAVVSGAWLGPQLHFDATATLEAAIQGLRNTPPCMLPFVFTQYCWLDFGQQWSVAHTARRAERCDHQYRVNGAMYIESMLRNTDWDEYMTCVPSFHGAFGNELAQSEAGRAWLCSVASADRTPVQAEADRWRLAGVDHYTVQWQNFKTLGLINTYAIENAFGVQYSLTLSHSNGTFRPPSLRSSLKMYWGFASDMWIVGAVNATAPSASLIRGSATYAFANATIATWMADNGTLPRPVGQVFHVFEALVGPFGSVDMKAVLCPATVKTFISTVLDKLRQVVATSEAAARAYNAVPSSDQKLMVVAPTVFLANPKWMLHSGSVLCPETTATTVASGLLTLTSRSDSCGQTITTRSFPTKDAILVAALAAQVTSATVSDVCGHESMPESCAAVNLGPAVAFLDDYFANFTSDAPTARTIADMADAAAVAVRLLEPSIVQFVRRQTDENAAASVAEDAMDLIRAPLFDEADPTFAFWAWIMVVEWARGGREVVAFEGDLGSVTVITEWTGQVATPPQPRDLPTAFTAYARAGLQYVTAVMLTLGVTTVLYVAAHRGRVDGLNMLLMNRVGGIVWVGRPLLLLRGVTALCLLSTATLDLDVVDTVSRFVVRPRPWYKTVLDGGEATWVVYILQDVFMVWTTWRTDQYASNASLLVWGVVAGLTLAWPVEHRASVAPTCRLDQMDFQLVCRTGVVVLGSVTRFRSLLGVVGVCNLVCFGWCSRMEWMPRRVSRHGRKTAPRPPAATSLLLCSGAKFLFPWRDRIYRDVGYMDFASALLNGLVTVKWKARVYVMEIKLWRIFAIDLSDEDVAFDPSALPLTD